MTSRRLVPLKLGVAAVAIVVASFLPWGVGEVGNLGMVIPKRVAITGWTGRIVLMGVEIPNFMTIVAALVLAVWSLRDPLLGRKGLAPVLAVYGLLHGLFAARFTVLGGGGGRGWPTGALLATAAFVGILLSMSGVAPDEPPPEERA